MQVSTVTRPPNFASGSSSPAFLASNVMARQKTPAEFHEFLADWLDAHVNDEDRRLAAYIQAS